MSSPFRITMWPGVPLAVPPVALRRVEVVDRGSARGGPFLVFREFRSLETPREELYLREVGDLDTTDADAMSTFCASFGRLGLPGWTELPDERLSFTKDMDALRDRYFENMGPPTGRTKPWPYFDDSVGPRFPFAPPESIVPLAEAAAYVQLLRDLTRVWQFHSEQLTLDDVENQWENPFLHPGNVDPAFDPKTARALLVMFLGYGLAAFHLRPMLRIEREEGSEILDYGRGEASLYAALCLQLANHITEEATYRTCLKCGRLFVRQRGRAQKGQYRTEGELLYCDTYHARAAAQAAYRKRQADARRKEKEGST